MTQGWTVGLKLHATKADFDNSIGIHPTCAEVQHTIDLRAWLGVIIVNNWLCLSVPLSVCHTPSNCFFIVSRWNRIIFWPSFLHVPLYKTLFFDLWSRPPNAQNLLPKICTKLPISQLVWQIDRRCLHLPGDFRGWPIQWNHAKCCGADPCCHGNEIWARHGDPGVYRLVSVFICLVCVSKWQPINLCV